MISIKQDSIAELVAEKLRNAIDSNDMKAGDRLREQEICEQLNVSRTPIREAFRILQVEGYLSYRPHYGVIVAELTEKDIDDVWEVRIHLEELIARKTAALADDTLKAQIRREITRIEEALRQDTIDEAQFHQIDEAYYDIHVSHCGNKKLEDEARSMRLNSALIRRKPKYSPQRARIALGEIVRIYQAYLDNDEKAAVKYNKEHFDASLKEIKRHL